MAGFPTNWIGKLTKADREAIAESIGSVTFYSLRRRNLRHLSDGERQRVMIARALAQDTGIILLDEPTAFLDLPNKFELVSLIRKLAEERNKAVLLSTHDLNIAIRESDKIWLLHDKGLSEGSPQDLIMRGHFMTMFEGSGLRFIEEEGSFRYSAARKLSVSLESVAPLELLTRQALERLGANISDQGSDHKIFAGEREGKPLWSYKGIFGDHEFDSLYELGWFIRINLKSS
ncbi:MAG: ABC transporter ATP-binding protein [Bacteroidales bacterium]